MSLERCAEHRALLVAYVRHELPPLDERHVAAHLVNCAACAGVEARLAGGLQAAASWEPELPPERLAELTARLTPFMPAPRERSWWPAALGALGMAAAAAALLVLLRPQAHVPVAVDAPPQLVLAPATPIVQRTVPVPHMHVVSGGGWDGAVRVDGAHLHVRASRGFAVFQFEGGEGRRLRIEAPGAVVEVVGTRFFVEVAQERTLVGVASGKVRVLAGGASYLLTAGESGSFGAGGRRVAVSAAAASWLDDPFLLDAEAQASPRRVMKKSRATLRRELDELFAPSEKEISAGMVLEQLQRAEDLERRGELKAAEAMLRAIANDPRPGFDPFRDLARYEIARLEGFGYGYVESARASMRRLSERAGGEVQRQATLALCELDLANDPCRSRACLMQLIEGSDFELGQEAEQLLDHWRLRAAACGDD